VVKRAINAKLFDRSRGVYDVSTTNRGALAQDANAMAILYGVAQRDEAPGILQRIEARLRTPYGPRAFSDGQRGADVVSPFASGFDVYAHFATGDAPGALDLIRTIWGQMTHDTPFYSGSVFEALAPTGGPERPGQPQLPIVSLSHSWASAPTSALSKYVLGVRPIDPGYRAWIVEPQTGDLRWAQGRIPTPFGPIDVSWRRASTHFALDLKVPKGTRATIGLPYGSRAKSVEVAVNGRPTRFQRQYREADPFESTRGGARRGYVYLTDLGPGTYDLVAPVSP
jgi:alpha-L-rhamnosidase